MNSDALKKYAQLIVNYCVSVQPDQKVYIRAATIAEPLVREVFRAAYQAGASMVEVDFDFAEKQAILIENGTKEALKSVSPTYKEAIENFDCYIYIRAARKETSNLELFAEKLKFRSKALKPLINTYMKRTGDLSLKRTLCEYPTEIGAEKASMSLEEYTAFILKACKLNLDNPKSGWEAVHNEQQRIVDYLNNCTTLRYKASHTDITFKTDGRKWINSDGQTNMPSGEVYTSPVEDSVNGHIHFTFPGFYMGKQVEGVTLYVEQGEIVRWEAEKGKDHLDKIFDIEGTRRFGEAAIGTNYDINQLTNNILFDEKMGGTVHMAIGQSYLQCGGKNESSVHWDMITEMTKDGEIYADEALIYQKGKFLI